MNLLSDQLVPRLGWALVHFVWQGGAIGLLAAVGLVALRRASAQARYVTACAALAAMVAAPIVTAALVAVPAPAPAPAPSAAAAEVAEAPAGFVPSRPSVAARDPTAVPPAMAASAPAPPAAHDPPETAWTTAATSAASALEAHFPPIVGLWTLGVGAMSLWYAGGWMRLRRLVRRETRPLADRWAAVAEDVSRRLGLRRAVRLVESATAGVPTVIGWLKPVVVLPASVLTGLPTDQVEALLAHELAHVRRWDDVVNLFQTAAEAVLFYHPAVWWLSRRIRIEREQCCDDVVVAVCGDRMAYARALATLGAARRSATPALAARGGRLLARIQRILSADPSPRTRAWWLAGTVACAATAVVLLGSLALAPEGLASDATGEARLRDDTAVLEADARILRPNQAPAPWSMRLSPDGTRLLYPRATREPPSNAEGGSSSVEAYELVLRDLDSGRKTVLPIQPLDAGWRTVFTRFNTFDPAGRRLALSDITVEKQPAGSGGWSSRTHMKLVLFDTASGRLTPTGIEDPRVIAKFDRHGNGLIGMRGRWNLFTASLPEAKPKPLPAKGMLHSVCPTADVVCLWAPPGLGARVAGRRPDAEPSPQRLFLYDLQAKREVADLPVHPRNASLDDLESQWTQDGRYLYYADLDNEVWARSADKRGGGPVVRIWDRTAGKATYLDVEAVAVGPGPTPTTMVLANRHSGGLILHDAASGGQVALGDDSMRVLHAAGGRVVYARQTPEGAYEVRTAMIAVPPGAHLPPPEGTAGSPDAPTLSAAERERLDELLPRMHLEKDWKPAAEELIKMGPAVAPHLLPLLDRGGTDAPAIHVLKALAEAPSVQDLMLEVLDKPPYKTINRRYGAMLVLGASKNPAHAPRLVAALEQAVALDPKIAGGELGPVFALSQLGGDAGFEGLVRALEIVSPDHTWLVAKHLAETDRADALPPLRNVLARINVRHQYKTFTHVAHAIRGLEDRLGQSWSPIEPLYAPVVRAAKRRNATVADAGATRFSPVARKNFQDVGPQAVYVYDLDTGQALERSVAPKGQTPVDAWMRTMGADLRVEAKDDEVTLVAVDVHLVPLEPKDWAAMTPARLAEAVSGQVPAPPWIRRHTVRRALKVPYAFRTREGGIGMFRPTRWIDKAPGMGVELKILERPPSALAAAMPTDEAESGTRAPVPAAPAPTSRPTVIEAGDGRVRFEQNGNVLTADPVVVGGDGRVTADGPRPGEAEAPWGEAVEGVQVRLRPVKTTWKAGETPRLLADVRNRGERVFLVYRTQETCELEIDGHWYRWGGDFSVKSSAFSPGREYTDIPITLADAWARRDASRSPPLRLEPGRHTVRVAFIVKTGSEQVVRHSDGRVTMDKPVRVVSNPVDIVVRGSQASAGPRKAPPAAPRPVTVECRHGKQTYRVAPGQWVPHGCSLAVPYRGGSHLQFELARDEGLHMTVRVDGGPPRVAWINANSDEGFALVKRELDRGTRGFVVLCTEDRLDALPPLPAGRDLALTVSGGLADFGPVMRHRGISALSVFSRDLADLAPLAEFRHLTSLRLCGCRAVTDLAPVARLPRLEWLRIVACPAITDFSPLAEAPALRGLRLNTGEAVSDLDLLAGLSRLQVLHLTGAKGVADLAPLAGLTDLRALHLTSTQARNLAPLASLAHLVELNLFASKQVADLGPLAGLDHLRYVDLRGCDAVTDLAPLAGVLERGGEVEVGGDLLAELARLREEDG